MVARRCCISSDSLVSIASVEPEHDPLVIDVRSEVKPLLRRVSPVVMLWTAPPSARECQGVGAI